MGISGAVAPFAPPLPLTIHDLCSPRQIVLAKNSALRDKDPQRYQLLNWVMNMVIGQFMEFILGATTGTRFVLENFQFWAPQEKKIDLSILNQHRIEHAIIEVYNTAHKKISHDLRDELKDALLPSASFELDLCKHKISNDKFLGTPILRLSRLILCLFSRAPL